MYISLTSVVIFLPPYVEAAKLLKRKNMIRILLEPLDKSSEHLRLNLKSPTTIFPLSTFF